MDRKAFLLGQAKLAAIEATQLALTLGLIEPTEMIVFTASVVPQQSRINHFLMMSIPEYFTVERFAAAGIDPRIVQRKILYGCSYENFGLYEPIRTVAELVACGQKGFSKRRNVGKESCLVIRRLFYLDGIIGF